MIFTFNDKASAYAKAAELRQLYANTEWVVSVQHYEGCIKPWTVVVG